MTAGPGTDNLTDRERVPDIVRDALRGEEEGLHCFRRSEVAPVGQHGFLDGSVLEAPNGRVVVREFTTCENCDPVPDR